MKQYQHKDTSKDFAVYFVEIRKRIIQEEGRDIAEDAELMQVWFESARYLGSSSGT